MEQRADDAVAVDLEHESVGGVGDEPAGLLLLVDLRLGAGEREGRGRAFQRKRGLECGLGSRAPAEAHRRSAEQDHQGESGERHAHRGDGRGAGGCERDAPGPAADLRLGDRGAAGAVREDGDAVGDTDVEVGREAGEGVADELVRGESAGDDPREGVAPLAGVRSGRPRREDGDEGEDAEPAVALNADGSGELRLAGRARDPERGGE